MIGGETDVHMQLSWNSFASATQYGFFSDTPECRVYWPGASVEISTSLRALADTRCLVLCLWPNILSILQLLLVRSDSDWHLSSF